MNAIKAARIRANLTQDELARKVKVDRTAVTKWETGVTAPRTTMLPLLAAVLHCTIDDLFEATQS